MKRMLALAGTLLLCACGTPEVRTPVPLGTLIVPNHAPWLILAPGPDVVEVRGLDEKVRLQPDPSVARALEAQLRAGVEADYSTNLTIGCDNLQTDMRVDADEAPGTVALDVSLHCTINARGRVSQQNYRAAPTATVKAGAGDAAYAAVLPILLRQAGTQMASSLGQDMRADRASGG